MKNNTFLSRWLSRKAKPVPDAETLTHRQILTLLDSPWQPELRPGPDGKYSVETLCLLTRHHNGYVREKALHALTGAEDISALDALLVAVNDWVKPVHHLAAATVIAWLMPASTPAFIAHLPQIRKLLTCKRYDHHAFVSQILRYLVDEDLPGLQRALHSLERSLRDAALRTLIEQDRLDDENALLNVLANRDSNLRAIAVEYWLAKNRLLSPGLILRLLQDPWARIRRAVLLYLDEHGQRPPVELYQPLLLDKNTLIQQRTRRMLEKVVDASAFWQQVVCSDDYTPTQRRSALYGLKEIRHPGLLALAQWGYTLQAPAIRNAALHILLELEGDGARERVTETLAHPSLALALAALRLLKHTTLKLTSADIQQLLDTPATASHRFIYWRLLHQLNKWDWLILLLRNHALLAESERDEQLQLWISRFNQAGIAPSARQRESLTLLLPQVPAFHQRLRGYLP
ncbi:HEAT repeat domain-containing protein [Phytobacter sp. V91]|uniref:HEAT repeat domain-containing protein n=1 Tax=Phytobacter sp. V91 TaxID=3369425 RepID=UPI003F5EB94A